MYFFHSMFPGIANVPAALGVWWRRSLTWVSWALALSVLSACSTLPNLVQPPIPSEAIPLSTSTTLGRIAAEYRPAPEQSGFRLMPLGSFSLNTRVELAKRAQVSLDVQYYHLENDESGRWLLRALRDAAARGVRVRLLIDDFYTSGEDELFLSLAAHPNFHHTFTSCRVGCNPAGALPALRQFAVASSPVFPAPRYRPGSHHNSPDRG